MTERKPPGVSFEHWVERQIREAQEAGAFDRLPGHGKPLDVDDDDPLWWIRRKLRDEGVPIGELPPALAVRQEVAETRRAIAGAVNEDEVRELVEAINARIRHVNRTTVAGPPTTVAPLDLGDVLRAWRAERG